MTKKVCMHENNKIVCSKVFRVRDKRRVYCRKHTKNGNRPNRSI